MKFIAAIILAVAIFFGIWFGLGNWLNYEQMGACGSAPDNSENCKKADVIIAISGGDTTARAEKAINLYKQNFAKNIIFSGAAADPSSPSNAKVMYDLAVKKGVPQSAIKLDETSENTRQNSENVAKILKENGWTNAILVSENYHLRRAYTNFVGADAQANFRTTAAKNQIFWWAEPRGWILIISEIGGMTKTAAGGIN
mgnify:CR=1 FL=1